MSHDAFTTLEVLPTTYADIIAALRKAGFEYIGKCPESHEIRLEGPLRFTQANICYGFNAYPGADPCEGNLGHMVWDPTHAKDERYTCVRHHAVAVRRAKLEGLEVEPL